MSVFSFSLPGVKTCWIFELMNVRHQGF